LTVCITRGRIPYVAIKEKKTNGDDSLEDDELVEGELDCLSSESFLAFSLGVLGLDLPLIEELDGDV
jgi:hypothetical protein